MIMDVIPAILPRDSGKREKVVQCKLKKMMMIRNCEKNVNYFRQDVTNIQWSAANAKKQPFGGGGFSVNGSKCPTITRKPFQTPIPANNSQLIRERLEQSLFGSNLLWVLFIYSMSLNEYRRTIKKKAAKLNTWNIRVDSFAKNNYSS